MASKRGSKPGERRGGRKAGTPNKATAEIKELAQQYTSEAVRLLARVMRSRASSETARVAAAKELLDRGHGRSTQAVALTGNLNVSNMTDAELKSELTTLLHRL